MDFFEVFKGDSIDNPEGFHFLTFKNGDVEFIVLRGYFYTCNGSFCNNGVLLVLNFQKDVLRKCYLVGVDKSQINLSNITGNIVNSELQLTIENLEISKKIILSFKDAVYLNVDIHKPLSEIGLFSINK